MAWNGTGTYNLVITFAPNTLATAADQNTQDTDIAGGITNCMAKDGQNSATANLNMGGFKLTQLANGTAATDAASFQQLSLFMPPGIVLPYAGASAPSGFLLCNGQGVSRTTYAALFGIIGTTFGAGDGSTTFALPALDGRTIAGLDPTGTVLTTFSMSPNGNTVGAIGGNEAHILTTPELAFHTHTAVVGDPGHVHGYFEAFGASATGSGATGFGGNTPASTNAATTGITVGINGAGGNNGHLNVQPTMCMNYIIKT